MVLAALLVVASSPPAGAASITVGGSCSLADAITAANTDAVAGGCAAGSGADVITLGGDVTLTADLPEITTDVTINGAGYTIDGAGAHHAFRITTPRITVRLNNLRVANSYTTTVPGGAIMIRTPAATIPVGVTVALNQVIVESNYTVGSGGGLFCGRSGFPFVNTPPNERISVTVDNSVFKNNRARSGGGAVSIVWSCTVTVNRSAFYGNSSTRAGFAGGAFRMSGRSHRVTRHEATLNITNSTIFGNTAGSSAALGLGESATAHLKHVTITNNTSSNASGAAVVQGTDQSSAAREGRLHVENSIIFGNTGHSDCNQARALKTNTGNMIGTGNCGAGTNPVSGDPKLTAEPGGVIPFYGLRPGSPAIDAVTCLSGVDVDQIGEARPNPSSASLATPCDVGAIEFDRPTTVSLSASGPLVEGGAPVTVTARFDSPTKTDGGLHLNLGGTATFGGSQKETNALNAGALALLRRVAPNHRLLNLPPPAGSDYWTPQQGISKHTSSSSVQGVGEIAVPAGSRTASFEITVLEDAVTDPNETITIVAMLRGPSTTNCVTNEGNTVCTGWAGLFYGNQSQTLTLTITDRPTTAGEQNNAPPPQNQQPQPQPQIPPPAGPQPQTGQPQPEPGEPEPAPNPGPQPEPEPEPVEPQPEPEPQPQLQEQPQQTDLESQPQQQQTQEVASPAVVTGLALTATANSVTASWQAPTTGTVVDKYVVQLKAPRGEKGKSRRVDGTKTTTTFRNLKAGNTYRVWVRTLNDAGKSPRLKAVITLPQHELVDRSLPEPQAAS